MLKETERKVIKDILKCKNIDGILASIRFKDAIELLDINQVEETDEQTNYINLIMSSYALGYMRGKKIKKV